MSVRVQVKHLSAVAVAQINPLEDDWASWVIARAKEHGWRVHHARPARSGRGWRTPVQGDVGAPDLLLARDGEVLHVELKRNATYLDPEQRAWLDALGPLGVVWRPRDAVTVLARLARPETGAESRLSRSGHPAIAGTPCEAASGQSGAKQVHPCPCSTAPDPRGVRS